jgi:hypothetical protein
VRITLTSRTTGDGYSILDLAIYGIDNVVVDETTTQPQTTRRQNPTTQRTTTKVVTTQEVGSTGSKNVETTGKEVTSLLADGKTTVPKTEVKKPGRVVIKKASKKKNAKKAKIVLKKMKSVSGYQIRYCENKKFQGYMDKTIRTKSTKLTLKGLAKGRKYYIKVRAYYKDKTGKYYGKWSKKVRVKIRRKK